MDVVLVATTLARPVLIVSRAVVVAHVVAARVVVADIVVAGVVVAHVVAAGVAVPLVAVGAVAVAVGHGLGGTLGSRCGVMDAAEGNERNGHERSRHQGGNETPRAHGSRDTTGTNLDPEVAYEILAGLATQAAKSILEP